MSSERRKYLAEKLKHLRNEYDLTQEELSEELYLSRSCLANYERAARMPNKDIRKAIANYFHISVAELMGEKKQKDK